MQKNLLCLFILLKITIYYLRTCKSWFIFFPIENKEIWVGFLKPCLWKYFWGNLILKSIYNFFALFSISICPLCNTAKSLGRWMQSYFTFEKIHTRLVPFTEYNDNFDIRYFKREEQRVLKKVTLEFWMGMPNTLKFFYVKLKQYFKKKDDIPISRKKPIFFEMLAAELLKWYDFKAYDNNNWVIFYINI